MGIHAETSFIVQGLQSIFNVNTDNRYILFSDRIEIKQA